MKRIFISFSIFCLALLSTGLKSYENSSPDDLYRDRIIGSWAKCEHPYSVATFEIGGKYTCTMWKTPQKREIILTEGGRWWIKNGRLYNTIHKMDPPLIPKMDKPIVDIIVSISGTEMTLIDEAGKRYQKRKV